MTFSAFYQQISKIIQVSARLPYFRIHQQGRINSDDIIALIDKLVPPRIFNILFQFNAQWTIIPRIGQTAVYFRAREYKATALAEGNYFFEFIVHLFNADWIRISVNLDILMPAAFASCGIRLVLVIPGIVFVSKIYHLFPDNIKSDRDIPLHPKIL